MNVNEIQCGFNEITTPNNEKRNLLLGLGLKEIYIFFSHIPAILHGGYNQQSPQKSKGNSAHQHSHINFDSTLI